jgi:hypothetical protein
MRRPQRSQPSRSARLSSGALSYTTLPEVLEHSTLRLPDIQRSVEGIPGRGILVKLFPVSPKNMRSVNGSKRTLWIVGSPDASSAFPNNREGAQKFGAKITQPTKAGSIHGQRAKANATNGKAEGRRLLVRGERKPLMSDGQGKGGDIETDDSSEEEDEDAENDNDEEVEEGGDGDEEEEEEEEEEGEAEEGEAEEGEAEHEEAGDEEAEEEEAEEEEAEEEEAEEEEAEEEEGEEEGGTENHNATKDVTTECNAMEEVENEHDAEEQDDDWNDAEHDEAQAKEADKSRDRQDEGEENREEDIEDEQEREKEAEEAGDMVKKPSETKEKDGADEDEQAEGNGDDEEAEEEMGTHDEVRSDREAKEQRVTANNRDGAQRDCKIGDVTDKEEEERNTGLGGDKRMARENDGDPEERRKRPLETCEAFDCPTPGDRPNKRSRSNEGESEDNAATDNLPRRPFSPETTPRLRTPSPTFTTASPASTVAIVRQTSVVPGLEDTKSAVWDAAQRDSVISSLPYGQQTKMVRAALSLSSSEGIRELRHFVRNARKNSCLRSETLIPDSDLIAPRQDLTVQHASNALASQDDGLAYFSSLYRHIDVLESKETLFAITKRVKLAAMARYRKSLVPEDVGGNRARDANLKLFRAVFPDHLAIERPENKAANPATYNDWIRLRDRLKEGRAWLEVQELFGGDGAFLALPPQCVPDSHVSRIPARTFASLLGLFEVAWRALENRARRTLDALVRLALAGQPLPGAALALERPEVDSNAPLAGLSPMLFGWSVSDCDAQDIDDVAVSNVTEREVGGEVTVEGAARTARTITTRTNGEEIVADAEAGVWNKAMVGLDDELFENVDFDEPLSQEI